MAYAAYWRSQYEPSQATPSPAAQVSTVKPSQFEASGSTMATKPGAAGSGVTAGGSASAGTAGKEAPKAKPETTPASQVKTTATTPPSAAGTAATTAVTKPKESTTAITTVKPDVPKVDPAKTSKPAAATGSVSVQGKKEEAKTSQAKVQVEVPSTTAKGVKEAPAADPFDALASKLPSAVSVPEPVYTGPEVTEHVSCDVAHKCGERDDTLPPGYRLADMPPAPADVKPKGESKPLTSDQAMDSLLHDFTASTAPTAPKKQEQGPVETITASSAGPTNFAPVKKSVPPVAVSPAPPADKKAKMETKVETKSKTDGGDSLSLDALSALGDTLPADKPKPEPPKLRPEDIVSEDKLKKEKGVRVGERDDTIPPEYRFKEDPLKKHPPPAPEPTMDTGDALDILSGDFVSSSAAPASQAPPPTKKSPGAPAVAVCPGPPADKKSKKDDFSLEAGLSATTAKKVESSAGPPVAVCPAPPADKKGKVEKGAAGKDTSDTKIKKDQGDSLSLDALGALGDTLPADKPKPEAPKLRPEDMVSEDKLKKEKGVRVGERDDTIPPEYRFKEDPLKKHPPPAPEPTMDTGDALDILSGDFVSSSAAPASQAPPPTKKTPGAPAVAVCPGPPADKKSKKDDFSLEAGLSATTAKKVESSAGPPVAVCPAPPADKKGKVEKGAAGKDTSDAKIKKDQGDSLSLDALGALGDTLPADKPKPEAPKLRPEDMVSEDKLKKEKGVRVGERDDTIPPEYRFKEDPLKKHPPPAPEPSLDTDDALDILSGDFTTSSVAPAVQAPLQKSACPPEKPSSAVPVQAQQGKPKIEKGDSLSLDALGALDDMLPADKPKPESPKLRPEDIVPEGKVKDKKAVRVGEREDTIPPEYRFKEDPLQKPPAPEPEPTMGDCEALDILSGGFSTPAQSSADTALDSLAGDFVAPTAASTVKSAACVQSHTAPQLATGPDDALDALSDTLKDMPSARQPAPVPAKDTVKEKPAFEEKVPRLGDRDDTLPAEYRLSEADRKKMEEEMAKQAKEPKEKPIDDDAALDLLSGDFSAAPTADSPAASCKASTKLDTDPLKKPMAGPVLDSMADTLLPDTPQFRSDKQKKTQAEQPPAANLPSTQLRSDVVPASTKKGGKS